MGQMMQNAFSLVNQHNAVCIATIMQNASMPDDDLQKAQARRLRAAREAVFEAVNEGWKHVRKFTDVSLTAYTQHENGTRGFKARAKAYAEAFNVSAAFLLWGNEAGPIEMKLVGKVAAGSEGFFDAAFAPGDGDPVFFDPDEISLVLQVDGDSMLPRYRHRDKIFFGFKYEDPTPLIGHEVMAQLSDDGRKLLKVLQRGSKKGLWTLYSVNTSYDPIIDVRLDWVLPVKWVKV